MAKSNDTIYSEFLADLKAINPKVEELLADEKVSSKLRESVLARADYSSKMDEVAKTRKDMDTYLAQERQKIDGWQKWYGDATKEVATVAEQLERYREQFGELDPQQQRQVARQAGMTTEQFDAQINKRLMEEFNKHNSAIAKFANDLTDIKIEHRERFKERLDTDSLYKIAGEKNLPLDVAYDVFIADRVEALDKSNRADELKRAREEGAREALAQHRLPTLTSAPTMTHVLDVVDAPRTSTDRVKAAVASYYGKSQG